MTSRSYRRTPALTSLRAFEAAARHNSFAKAAAELNLTAAAVSHRVKQLETQLGIALFERKTRGVILSDSGRRYREQIATAFQIIEQATAAIDQPGIDGPLLLSTPASFADFWLLPRLGRLTDRFPGLELTIQGDSRLMDLRAHQADIGIRFGAGRYQDLHCELLFGDKVTVLVPADHLSGLSDTRPATVIGNSTLLEDNQVGAGEPWMSWEPWLREAGVAADRAVLRRLYFSGGGLSLRACLNGLGTVVGRLSLVHEPVRRHQLTPLLPWRSTEFAYYLVTRPGERDNPRVMALRTWLLEEIGDYAEHIRNTFAITLT